MPRSACRSSGATIDARDVYRVGATGSRGLSVLGAALCAQLLGSPHAAAAAGGIQTFGPGTVNCQALTGTHVDCLLADSRVTQDNSNVATFSIADLPRDQQALFRKWCLSAADECTVTVTGRLASPQTSRLETVTSVHWTRPSAPVSDVAAGAAAKTSPTDQTGPANRPAQ